MFTIFFSGAFSQLRKWKYCTNWFGVKSGIFGLHCTGYKGHCICLSSENGFFLLLQYYLILNPITHFKRKFFLGLFITTIPFSERNICQIVKTFACLFYMYTINTLSVWMYWHFDFQLQPTLWNINFLLPWFLLTFCWLPFICYLLLLCYFISGI